MLFGCNVRDFVFTKPYILPSVGVLVAVFLGCHAKKQEVQYNQPPKSALKVRFSTGTPTEWNSVPDSSLAQVQVGSPLIFSGEIDYEPPDHYTALICEIRRSQDPTTGVVLSSGHGMPEVASDGRWKYELSLPAPREKGDYLAYVRDVKGYIARGRLRVVDQ